MLSRGHILTTTTTTTTKINHITLMFLCGMSSSMAATSTAASGPSIVSATASGLLGGLTRAPINNTINPVTPMIAQFREIHKNTWLKRLTTDGKKITVGPKKSERSWVVFCVHDDTEALLEGYADPRQAPSHNPEWIVSMQDTLHISHALIPNSHEFEFVVTLSSEVVRFHAMDIMQEWVETLRSKLREMKILSPRENLYTKLPEVRAPLLPTRDPTSPLPAPPPVPAALVPGVERIPPQSAQHQINTLLDANSNENANISLRNGNSVHSTISDLAITSFPTSVVQTTTTTTTTTTTVTNTTNSSTASNVNSICYTTTNTSVTSTTSPFTSMSNTLTQNLLNMLSDPISAYSEQINDAVSSSSSLADDADDIALSNSIDKELNLSLRNLRLNESSTDDDSIGPLLRKPSESNDNSCVNNRAAEKSKRIPNYQSSKASSSQKSVLESCDHHHNNIQAIIPNNKGNNNITELEINADVENLVSSLILKEPVSSSSVSDAKTNITIIQVSTTTAAAANMRSLGGNHENVQDSPKLSNKTTSEEIFTFPENLLSTTSATTCTTKQHEYRSNVQIIPSNIGSSNTTTSTTTVQVIGNEIQHQSQSASNANQYSNPLKKQTQIIPSAITDEHNQQITTVHVLGKDTTYGTLFSTPSTSASSSHTSTPKLSKKIILSANASGITNITVNNIKEEVILIRKPIHSDGMSAEDRSTSVKINPLHYDKVFLSSSVPNSSQKSNSTVVAAVQATCASPKRNSKMQSTPTSSMNEDPGLMAAVPVPPSSPIVKVSSANGVDFKQKSKPQSPKQVSSAEKVHKNSSQLPNTQTTSVVHPLPSSSLSSRRRVPSPQNLRTAEATSQKPFGGRTSFLLTRGHTEAVISSRPSRRDFHLFNKVAANKKKGCHTQHSNANISQVKPGIKSCNNNGDSSPAIPSSSAFAPSSRVASESLEQRRRSSSTSDAHTQHQPRGTNNNEVPNRSNAHGNGPLRQPPHPFRIADNLSGISNSAINLPTSASPSKRMSLREQQVMQLRREIMHPGGVRLQLRRKDCLGSIAWVDAFGWKQREHPVLYNALHIGDQLLSIAGVTINSAAEANKIIRNANTLFVEVLLRRIPFGRGYAIRRDREGQCLGLIRDGNTATIVDVVPNSLAARHGLPPKAQSFDGSTLTFWILTEINGRPLNLFFKENEIRDRLNSVGRDISILVQPSDLITKLKKQLKSLRSYKDYLVQ
uniref:PH domain-containing protein n=1 Tax=Glossina brevipalpis TaxID=37001 RepID=A0A1A9W1A3_9MUSC